MHTDERTTDYSATSVGELYLSENEPKIGRRNFWDSKLSCVISVRFLAMLSTVLLVVGALLVGEAIHGGVVQGTYDLTSPWVVLRVVLGSIFIALGYRFKTPTEEYVATPSDGPDQSNRTTDQSPDPDQTGDFDPEMSPLGGDGLEHVDGETRDDARGDDARSDDTRE